MHNPSASNDPNTEIFLGFLDTFNAALQAHIDKFPYKQLVRGGEALLDGDHISVGVFKHDPKKPHIFHTIKIEDGEFKYVGRGKQDTRIGFRTAESRLTEVAQNPEPYINDPEQLDLDWLKKRLGLRLN